MCKVKIYRGPFYFSPILLAVLFSFSFNSSFSQGTDYFLKSSDNELAIEVSRSDKGIEIALYFTNASQFEYVTIEKSGDAQNGFSQCKYIKFNESANDSVVIVKRDVYPLNASEDVYYRVKTITKDGASRVYPSVRLPGLHVNKNSGE